MIKSIFVPLSGIRQDGDVLQTAFAVAKPFEAHLDCLHVRPDPRLLIAGTTASMESGLGAGVFPSELWATLVDADKRRAKAAKDGFDDFCKRHQISVGETASAHGVSAAFREIEGDAAKETVTNGRFADLIVLGSHSISSEASWDAAGDVITGCGRPLLLAPVTLRATIGTSIAIAWKNTAEASRAVTAAMPFLEAAKEIFVLSASEGSHSEETSQKSAERLAEQLRRHGFSVHAEHIVPGSRSVPVAVTDRALTLKCDLLVMGAYSHSRMREFVFGGFTQHVLKSPALPVMLMH
jgi:nucleotide-binding universal stress UspA family protein